ncbi:hypothetical protein L484_025501 [Morus notabilis]|uniref:Uncharacterized protein n=1 Tax=Morus notabilis TaxID=981085 RepID=W9RZI6_9ROSA|nr:hypothetical protein L484_025501 [Morus notabilis]
MGDQYYRTFFDLDLRVDVEKSTRFSNATVGAPKHYMIFQYNYRHLLRSDDIRHPQHPDHVEHLAATEDRWFAIPRVEHLLSRMRIPAPETIQNMTMDICWPCMLAQPLYADCKVLIFSLEVKAVTPYDEERLMENVMAESASQDQVHTAVPAASSVEGLKNKVKVKEKVADETRRRAKVEEYPCAICMEDLSHLDHAKNNLVTCPALITFTKTALSGGWRPVTFAPCAASKCLVVIHLDNL